MTTVAAVIGLVVALGAALAALFVQARGARRLKHQARELASDHVEQTEKQAAEAVTATRAEVDHEIETETASSDLGDYLRDRTGPGE